MAHLDLAHIIIVDVPANARELFGEDGFSRPLPAHDWRLEAAFTTGGRRTYGRDYTADMIAADLGLTDAGRTVSADEWLAASGTCPICLTGYTARPNGDAICDCDLTETITDGKEQRRG